MPQRLIIGIARPEITPAPTEAEAALAAIRSGTADALVGDGGDIIRLISAEMPYATFFSVMNEGGVILDHLGRILHANSRFIAMTGRSIEELRMAMFSSRVARRDRSRVAEILTLDRVVTLSISLVAATGRIPVQLSSQYLEAGTARYLCLVLTDLTERAKAENELRIADIAFESQLAAMVTDRRGVILRVNRAFTALTGYAAAEAVGASPAFLKSGRHDEAFYQRFWQALTTDKFWQGTIWNRRKDGKIYAEWLTVSAVCSASGAISNYFASYSEISKNKDAEAEIHRLAYYDALTMLPNRRLLRDWIGQAMIGSERSKLHCALLFLDLDNFKVLNDTRGHAVGDHLLLEVAGRIQSNLRLGDTVARLGGDEFVVILEGLNIERQEAATQASLIGEKIREAIALPFDLDGSGFQCTASVGALLFQGLAEDVDTLLQQADLAMYRSKSTGRNALRFFDPAMQTALDERSALEGDLRRALKNGEFHLHFQPQFSRTRRVIGAEVLLRWSHPTRGAVSPADFIPLAEDTGLILPIGQWVLEAVCAQLKSWSGAPATRDLRIAVNVSARQFRQTEFVEQLKRILKETGADPTRLKIELTESIVIDNMDKMVAHMASLNALGIGFSMDDFGTGYSSLSSLKRLPLEQLKIDQAFVRDLATDANDAAIVQTIINIGTTLGLDVIAEGVETEAQWERLMAYGCFAYQGYLLSRPLPLEAFVAVVENDYCKMGDIAVIDRTADATHPPRLSRRPLPLPQAS